MVYGISQKKHCPKVLIIILLIRRRFWMFSGAVQERVLNRLYRFLYGFFQIIQTINEDCPGSPDPRVAVWLFRESCFKAPTPTCAIRGRVTSVRVDCKIQPVCKALFFLDRSLIFCIGILFRQNDVLFVWCAMMFRVLRNLVLLSNPNQKVRWCTVTRLNWK